MEQLAHFFSYLLSAIFYMLFGMLLVLFHPIQWIAYNLLGYSAHKRTVEVLNAIILFLLGIVGARIRFKIPDTIPENVPLIVVANHQSLWDIPPMVWFLRKYHPKFISKKELGKGIPSVSYNLKHGGSVLIDRNKPEEAVMIMKGFAQYLNHNNRTGVIFPEGTRSRDGRPKIFKKKGLQTLFDLMPDAYVLPITINNSWKMQQHGMYPIPLGVRLEFKVHPIIRISDHNNDALIDLIEEQIVSKIN